MLTSAQRQQYQQECLKILGHTGTVLRPEEAAGLELADFGLGTFAAEGLGLVVYENNSRYCAKELIMLPGQSCPQHRHPPVGSDPGKMETFRCRWGKVFLYVDGAASGQAACRAPAGKGKHYTVWREIVLGPGEQFTIPPNTWHWFQAGAQGAVVSEFSSTSRDEADVFADPAIVRVEK